MEKMILCVMLMPVMCYCEVAGSVSVSSEAAVYEYVPKVIIEGKWGKGAGEFGRDIKYLEGGEVERYEPDSLAVNSKGEIYILDIVNNRIQKFDKEGKYLLSIPVESFKVEPLCWMIHTFNKNRYVIGNIKESEKGEDTYMINRYLKHHGVNIVIDSKDRMYYYVRSVKDVNIPRKDYDEYPKEDLGKIKLEETVIVTGKQIGRAHV